MDWTRARDRCLQILANNSYWFFETYLHICEKITRFLGKNSHMANFSQIYILDLLWNAHASLCQNLVSLILAVGSNTLALSKPLACNEATQFAKSPVSYSWSTTAPCPTAANKDVISVFGQQEKATANSPNIRSVLSHKKRLWSQSGESSKTFIWAAPKLAVEFYRFTVKTIFLDLSSRPSSLLTKQFSKLCNAHFG